MENTTFDYEKWKKSNSTNEELAEFYETFDWKPISQTQGEPPLTGPFLPFPYPNYESQEKKVLIFGQETFGWAGSAYGSYSALSRTKDAFNCYIDFFNNDSKQAGNAKTNYSPFWRTCRSLAGEDLRI